MIVKANNRIITFTLIEVYLLLMTIMVLIILMMPSVMSSKKESMKAVCTFNLRTIGLALALYQTEYTIYPIEEPLISQLYKEEFLKNPKNRCPLDSTNEGDTYSYGYIGGHPGTMRDDDPLVVCGWHRRIGSLAVFTDTSVADLNGNKMGATLPVSITHGSSSVEPRFVLHDSEAVVVRGATGDHSILFGKNGSYYIAASYDPFANKGKGLFSVALGFDISSLTGPEIPEFRGGTLNTYVRFYTRLPYANVEVTSNPAKGETSISWEPDPDVSLLSIVNHGGYRLAHRVSGDYKERTDPEDLTKYEIDIHSLSRMP